MGERGPGYFGGDDGAGYAGALGVGYPPVSGGAHAGGGYSPAPLAGVASGGVGPVVRFLPEWVPIPTASEFNSLGQNPSAAIESGVLLAGANVQLAPGERGRIASVNLFVTNLTQTSQLTFTVFINGVPLDGWTNVGVFPGTTARLSENFGAFIRIPLGGLAQIRYSNADGGAYTVGAAFSGWKWADSDGKRYLEQGA